MLNKTVSVRSIAGPPILTNGCLSSVGKSIKTHIRLSIHPEMRWEYLAQTSID